MFIRFDVPTPLAYFASLVHSDAEFPLLEAAASLAQDEYPELDIQQVLGEVDQLLERVKRRVPSDAPALQRLRALNQLFYRDLGFGGNLNNYYDPENSYLSVVLRNRRGIPISLAVLWLELALGLGLNASGVAFPGHFMLKVSLPTGQVVMDPLTGQSLSREDLSERLEPFRRRGFQHDDFDAPIGLYLQPAPARDIIARMLRNLKEVHRTQEDWARLIPVLDRLITLLPQAWGEYRDRGLALAEQGQVAPALADLEVYLSNAEDGLDIDAIAERALELRRG